MPFSRNQNMYSIERYDFEGVQLIERVALFLFQMTVIPSAGGSSLPTGGLSQGGDAYAIFFHIHHFRRRDL